MVWSFFKVERWYKLFFPTFSCKFYHSAVVPDTEVKKKMLLPDAIPDNKIKTEKKRTEPEKEKDDLAQYNK